MLPTKPENHIPSRLTLATLRTLHRLWLSGYTTIALLKMIEPRVQQCQQSSSPERTESHSISERKRLSYSEHCSNTITKYVAKRRTMSRARLRRHPVRFRANSCGGREALLRETLDGLDIGPSDQVVEFALGLESTGLGHEPAGLRAGCLPPPGAGGAAIRLSGGDARGNLGAVQFVPPPARETLE